MSALPAFDASAFPGEITLDHVIPAVAANVCALPEDLRPELRGDIAVLEAVLAPEFRGDDPRGQVLCKTRWIDRHRTDDVLTTQFAWRTVAATSSVVALPVGALDEPVVSVIGPVALPSSSPT